MDAAPVRLGGAAGHAGRAAHLRSFRYLPELAGLREVRPKFGKRSEDRTPGKKVLTPAGPVPGDVCHPGLCHGRVRAPAGAAPSSGPHLRSRGRRACARLCSLLSLGPLLERVVSPREDG